MRAHARAVSCPPISRGFHEERPLPPPVRPGHCSVCGVKSISDPCELCGVESVRRIASERAARAKRELEVLTVGSEVGRRTT